jgi:hypothetical protein
MSNASKFQPAIKVGDHYVHEGPVTGDNRKILTNELGETLKLSVKTDKSETSERDPDQDWITDVANLVEINLRAAEANALLVGRTALRPVKWMASAGRAIIGM